MSLLKCRNFSVAYNTFLKQLLNLAFIWRIMEIEEGVTSTDNTLWDLHNSSDDVNFSHHICRLPVSLSLVSRLYQQNIENTKPIDCDVYCSSFN